MFKQKRQCAITQQPRANSATHWVPPSSSKLSLDGAPEVHVQKLIFSTCENAQAPNIRPTHANSQKKKKKTNHASNIHTSSIGSIKTHTYNFFYATHGH